MDIREVKIRGGKPIFSIGYSDLNRLYIVERLSIHQIARLCGISYSTILRQLQKYGIVRRGRGEAHKGKVVSKETRTKISVGNKGNTKWLGKHHDVATRNRLSAYHMGTLASDETKAKMRDTHIRRWQDDDLRRRVSEAHKRNWQNPEYRDKVVRNTALAQNVHPNTKETIMLSIFQGLGLNDWDFMENKGVSYGGRRPDFMDVCKRDRVIEMFGDYWHTEKVRCYEETEEGRIAHFAKYGLPCLVIWEHELKEPDVVKARIVEFVKASAQQPLTNS